MKAYIYKIETNEVVMIADGETNEQIENHDKVFPYIGSDEYGVTYSPAFGSVDALVMVDDAETIDCRKKS